MTWTTHFRALAGYNRWMNERLYAVSAELSDEERRRDVGAFFKSLHGTLNHLVLADSIWLGRFHQDPLRFFPRNADGSVVEFRSLDQILYDDFGALAAQRHILDDVIERWTSELTEPKLLADLVYIRSGQRIELPLWWAASHFFNHQTHHRGQVTTILNQFGRDPGVTDLFVFHREHGRTL